MIQIRNVPDELHLVLKVRAAKSGMTLSDYLLAEVRAIAEKPTLTELSERIRHRGSPGIEPETIVELIRQDRDAR